MTRLGCHAFCSNGCRPKPRRRGSACCLWCSTAATRSWQWQSSPTCAHGPQMRQRRRDRDGRHLGTAQLGAERARHRRPEHALRHAWRQSQLRQLGTYVVGGKRFRRPASRRTPAAVIGLDFARVILGHFLNAESLTIPQTPGTPGAPGAALARDALRSGPRHCTAKTGTTAKRARAMATKGGLAEVVIRTGVRRNPPPLVSPFALSGAVWTGGSPHGPAENHPRRAPRPIHDGRR